MRIPVWLTITAALIAVGAVALVGTLLIQPPQPLITSADMAPAHITPNADGSDDIALVTYSLSRGALVSLTFTGEDGAVYAFRENERRAPDAYSVLFSGVVDGYLLPGEPLEGDVLRRLMPDGMYTWRLTAQAENGETDERSGMLTISEGDAPLPQMTNFTISPATFTPNQDGIDDRVQINLMLAKDAELSVYLEGTDGAQYFVPERQEDVAPGLAGRHWFDYAGGIDENADPPPDGDYRVIAEAQDAVGQRMRREAALTLRDGGKPLAQIIPQPSGADVAFVARPDAGDALVARPDGPDDVSQTAITMPLGNLLVFRLTIENYSDVPIRTTGPAPGTVYDQSDRASTLGYYESSGAWRVGLDCENAISDYPWRWAVGADENLTLVTDPDTGEVFRYLPPGARSVVWGAVRMTELIETSNPQMCWAGLIHEDVEISVQNSRVGPREVELVPRAAS